MPIFFFFALGLVIGSFLNVVIFRYSPEHSLFRLSNWRGRSHCQNCGSTLSWHELIPLISFLIQRGRCRHCGAGISWQYPLVEFLSGLIFLLPIYFTGIQGWIWLAAFLALLLIAAVDYRLYIIPDELNLVLAGLGALRVGLEYFYKIFGELQGSFLGNYALLFGLRQNVFINHLAGLAVGALIIGLIVAVTRGKGMGVGDLKLAGALGFLFGWPDIIFLLAFSFIIGSLASIFLLIRCLKGMKDIVPFGPFLVLGAAVLLFWGKPILDFYFSLIGLG